MKRRTIYQAHPRFVPDRRYVPETAPWRSRLERGEWAIFLVGLLVIPFVLAVLPR